jgi:hypothetical protein
MDDQQFKTIRALLQFKAIRALLLVMLILLGYIAGRLLASAW